MVFIIFLFIKSFHLFYIIFISESIISLCHQLSWTTFWMPRVIKTYHTHTPDRLCRYSPPWCVLSTGADYLCFFVQLLVPVYYTQVRTIPREIRYVIIIIFQVDYNTKMYSCIQVYIVLYPEVDGAIAIAECCTSGEIVHPPTDTRRFMNECWFDVGPPSTTLDQRLPNIDSTSCVWWADEGVDMGWAVGGCT